MFTEKALITTLNETETATLGFALGSIITEPAVITLNGNLGAGKTVMVKGAAAALGVKDPVRSPTFTLMLIYEGRLPVYHFDFYRLEDESELENLGLEEYLEGQGVAFIEWGLRFPPVLPPSRLDINIEYDIEDDTNRKRIITFHPHGPRYINITDTLFESLTHNIKGKIKL